MSTVKERVDKIADNHNLSLLTEPTTAKIELTGSCTLNCWFCNHKEMKERNERQGFMGDVEFDLALKYLHYYPSVKEVGLFYMGESGLHPKLARYYKILKDMGYFTFLTTNATYIDNTLKAIPYIDSLKVSWNYKNEEDFKQNFAPEYRKDDLYHKIIENVKRLHEACKAAGKPLAVSTVLDTCREDYEEALSHLSYDEHYWIPLQNQGGTQKEGEGGVIGEADAPVSPMPCWSLFKGIYIDCDLNVRSCCYGHGDEHILWKLGTVWKERNSAEQMKALQLAGEIPVACKKCLHSFKKTSNGNVQVS